LPPCRGGAADQGLDTKTKELIALAIGVAVRCDDCIAFHAKAAVDQGATPDEIFETLGMAVYMGAGPSMMYAAHALDAYKQFADLKKQQEAARG
jgi:AhpD family alkylhydroperoxidase